MLSIVDDISVYLHGKLSNIFSMNKQLLKRIIVEKQVAIPTYKLITRAMRFEKRVNYVLVGLRRAGKSYLLYQDIQTKIHEKEITAEHILYINFEDERLLGMQTEELDNLLEAYRELYPNQRPWIYLDEIQNIIGWEKSARWLTRSPWNTIQSKSYPFGNGYCPQH